MLNPIRIYADFLKLDDDERLILICQGTKQDLAHHNIELKEGLILTFYTDDADDNGNRDDLIIEGTVQYDNNWKRWTAAVDWQTIKHVSDYNK